MRSADGGSGGGRTLLWTRPRRCWPARTSRGRGERGEGAAERVTLTTDDATLPAAAGIAALLHAQGYVVERRAFVGSTAARNGGDGRSMVTPSIVWPCTS